MVPPPDDFSCSRAGIPCHRNGWFHPLEISHVESCGFFHLGKKPHRTVCIPGNDILVGISKCSHWATKPFLEFMKSWLVDTDPVFVVCYDLLKQMQQQDTHSAAFSFANANCKNPFICLGWFVGSANLYNLFSLSTLRANFPLPVKIDFPPYTKNSWNQGTCARIFGEL